MIEPMDVCEPVEVASSTFVFNAVVLSTRIMPADHAPCGGDWCETFVVSENVIALSIGDVSGHGVAQNGSMVRIRKALKAAALSGLDPVQTLTAADRAVREVDADLHATACFALLDTVHETMTFANAGHPPPLMVGNSGASFLGYQDADMPLGTQALFSPALHTVRVPPDTLLVFYTDGVTEHDLHPIRGERQLLEAASVAYQASISPVAGVIENLMSLTGPNRDDASILTAWTPPTASDQEAMRVRRRRGRPDGLAVVAQTEVAESTASGTVARSFVDSMGPSIAQEISPRELSRPAEIDWVHEAALALEEVLAEATSAKPRPVSVAHQHAQRIRFHHRGPRPMPHSQTQSRALATVQAKSIAIERRAQAM